LGLLCACDAHAQLVISEVCTKNNQVLQAPDGGYPDWVELFNASDSPIALGHYFLSDRSNELDKWRLPDEDLPPGGYKLLFSGGTDPGTDHFTFGLSQEGEGLLLSEEGDLVQSMVIPWIRADHSYGIGATLGSGPYFYDMPTPGYPNTSTGYPGYTATPVGSRAPGFHPASIEVVLSAADQAEVHFTTDGRDPDGSSPIASGSMTLDSSTVIKAVALKDGFLRSEFFIGTYLINEHTDLPVVSLSAHPDSLFSWENGIYVLGPGADPEYPHYGANFWDERYVPADFQFFDDQHRLGLSQRVDLSIHGGRASRNMPQRPLRLTARKEHGPEVMVHPFFEERPAMDRFKRLILRNSGADFCLSEMRDGLFHQISLHNDLDIDELAFRPALVYINGRYWGLMNIRERIDEDHLHFNYGADRDNLLFMEEENVPVQGDPIHFQELYTYIREHDMNDPAHFAHVNALMDLENFKDYFALEIYAGNADWPSNNLKYWKPSITEGKWRYVMYDMDATMNPAGWIPMDFDMFHWILEHRAGYIHAEIYRSLMSNTEFRRTFLNRLADMMNTALTPEAFGEEAQRIRERIAPEIPRHFDRWGCNLWYWHEQAEVIIPEFAVVRPDHVRNDVLTWYDLPNTAELGFAIFPQGAGKLRLNSLKPGTPFTGTYFNGNAIDLSVISEPGFEFDHWEYTADAAFHSHSEVLQRSFASDGTITAYFRDTDTSLRAYPNPFMDATTISVQGVPGGSATVTVHDAQGRLVYTLGHAVQAGVNAVELRLFDLASGIYQVRVEVAGSTAHTAILKLDR
jgi:hypothetical protein